MKRAHLRRRINKIYAVFLLLFYGVKFSDSGARDPRKFNSCFKFRFFPARLATNAAKIAKWPLCRYSFVKFNPLAAVTRAPNLAQIKLEKDMKRRPICFFLDCDLGLIVFELKFTGRNPDGKAILALVFAVAVAIRPQALFEGDRFLPRYRVARLFS